MQIPQRERDKDKFLFFTHFSVVGVDEGLFYLSLTHRYTKDSLTEKDKTPPIFIIHQQESEKKKYIY